VRIVSIGATEGDLLEFPVMIYLGFSIAHDPREALDEARGGIARRVLNFVYYRALPRSSSLCPEVEAAAGLNATFLRWLDGQSKQRSFELFVRNVWSVARGKHRSDRERSMRCQICF